VRTAAVRPELGNYGSARGVAYVMRQSTGPNIYQEVGHGAPSMSMNDAARLPLCRSMRIPIPSQKKAFDGSDASRFPTLQDPYRLES